MRLVAGMLAVLLAHPVALAEDAGGAAGAAEKVGEAPVRQKVPIRVVRIMPETNQALVYDRTGGGTHLLVTVGEKIGGYTIEAIDEDEVTLSANGRQIVLAAPDRPWRRRHAEARSPADPSRVVRGGEPAPADPYGSAVAVSPAPGAGAPGPTDPYAEEIREVKAPSAGVPGAGAPGPADPYAEEIREVKAPSWIAPAPAPALAATPSPIVTPAPVGVRAPAAMPAAATIAPAAGADPVLARAEVDAALGNFGALTVAFRASFTPEGVKVQSLLESSLFAKAGLRAGDVIASVDGRPLRSLDDVAALYARAGALRAVTAQVVRGGKPLTLRVSIQ